MNENEKLDAMKKGAEIARAMFANLVRRFPTRAEVGASPASAEYEHFQNCAATINAFEFEADDFQSATLKERP